MSEQSNICAKCAHCVEMPEVYECIKHVDVVSGGYESCYAVREEEHLCGPEGKWFEPRQNLKNYVEQAPIFTYTSGAPEVTATKSAGQMYQEDDPSIASRIQKIGNNNVDKLKPFTDYKPENN